MALSAGETFERYTIEDRIGLGGLGEVYRAFDTRLQRKVAIKIIRREKASDWNTAVARFLREARIAASLAHPNTVAIHDLGETRGTFFLVMELIRGTTLRSYVTDTSIPLELKLEWLAGIARGLAAAHEAGIVHRDVKPSNIMITSEGVPKVLDFGLAKPQRSDSSADTDTTKVGQLLGTPRYMAPEQREGKEADARSDQFSYGITAYELLAMRHPDSWLGPRKPLREVAPEVDFAVAASIDRMLSDDPSKRFPSMAHASAAIELFARANSISMTLSIATPVTGDEPETTEQRMPPSIVPAARSTDSMLPSTMPPPITNSSLPPEQTEEMTKRLRALDPRALNLNQAFATTFTTEPFGSGRYGVEVRATEHSTHPMVLVPGDTAYGAIVMGSLNPAKGSAEIRAFDYVGLMHAQRRSAKPFIDRSTYERLIRRMRALLKANGIASIAVVAPPADLRGRLAESTRESQPPPPSGAPTGLKPKP